MKKLHLQPRAVFSLALLGWFQLLSHGYALAEEPGAPKQYLIHCALKRELSSSKGNEKKLKIDAEPIIVANENSDSRIVVGGERKVGRQSVFNGTRVDFNLQTVAEDKVLLEGKVEVSHVRNHEAGLAIREATEIYFSQPVDLHKQVKFSISKTDLEHRWLEIRVEPIAVREVKVTPVPKTAEPMPK